MNTIINSALYVLLLSCVIGSLMTLFWMLLRKQLEDWLDVRCTYRILRYFIMGYLFPLAYFAVYSVYLAMNHRSNFILHAGGLAGKIAKVLFCIWILGIVLRTAANISCRVFFRRIVKEKMLPSAQQQRVLKQLCSELDIRTDVRLYQGYCVMSPFTRGLIHPTIYLPVKRFKDHELKMILCHELYHIKQRDAFWRPLFAIVNFVYWFNPLSGYLWNQLSLWAEASCDAECCREHFTKKEYFMLLCNLKDPTILKAMDIAPMWSEGRNQLLWRITQMDKKNTRRISRVIIAAVAMASMLVSGVMTCAAANGVDRAYNAVFWSAKSRASEEVISTSTPVPDRTVEYGTVEELGEIQVMEPSEDGITPYSGAYIEWTVGSGVTSMSSGFDVSKGGTIKLGIYVSKKSDKIKVGIMEPDGTTQFVKGGGDVVQSFTAKKGGTHAFFICNGTGSKITAWGSYSY